ncbi:Uncharacterised protein [Mycobacteroides abscessus subsp. bolletii]|uniref:hypothetical protein n=1 Tax=Mycobacteroides abscessus TaxID=36809 RepID=UPI0003860F54|nr:hypothetical protein [Mycobacteroides abscessus]EPZ18825.1 hypothetical protein M879_19685 [Mycobacteroides abscessus V06705]MDO3267854.1 hypothetical protein [Mycobacteroides abscessus subsp. abscessus]SKS73175.1 Uncharacterised protein [Mycobacteroides abscessus subsp. bolletii]SKS83617.1 Uncharacterised protein [Mycobacteroides abscessus subsp. bolletii]
MHTDFLQDRAVALVGLLHERGLTMSLEACKVLIAERVDFVGQQLGVGQGTARSYLTDEALGQLADLLVDELIEECPGANLHELPRTVAMPYAVVGRTVSALAEVLLLYGAHGPIDEIADSPAREVTTLVSMLGFFISENASTTTAAVSVPPAFLYRVNRILHTAADHPDATEDLSAALRRDAIRLRAITS